MAEKQRVSGINKRLMLRSILALIVCGLLSPVCFAKQQSSSTSKQAQVTSLKVAVASNFAACLEQLADDFQRSSGITITPVVASTGKLVNQIRFGAPFDLLIAAETERPEWLIDQQLVTQQSLLRFARGQLLLVVDKSAKLELAEDAAHQLQQLSNQQLAIANPLTAPYGASAQAWLNSQQYQQLSLTLLQAENVVQAWQYLDTGGAPAAIIAASVYRSLSTSQQQALHAVPIETPDNELVQSLLVINDSSSAQAFKHYLSSAKARAIMQNFGYLTISSD